MWVEGELGQGEGWDTKKERLAETLETAEREGESGGGLTLSLSPPHPCKPAATAPKEEDTFLGA